MNYSLLVIFSCVTVVACQYGMYSGCYQEMKILEQNCGQQIKQYFTKNDVKDIKEPFNAAFDCVQKKLDKVNCLDDKGKKMVNSLLNAFKPTLNTYIQYVSDNPEVTFDGKSAYMCAAMTFGTGKVKPPMKLITGIWSEFNDEACSAFGEMYELVGKAIHDNCRNSKLYDQVMHLLYIFYSNLKECVKYDSYMSHDKFSNHDYPVSSSKSLVASSILILLTSIILIS